MESSRHGWWLNTGGTPHFGLPRVDLQLASTMMSEPTADLVRLQRLIVGAATIEAARLGTCRFLRQVLSLSWAAYIPSIGSTLAVSRASGEESQSIADLPAELIHEIQAQIQRCTPDNPCFSFENGDDQSSGLNGAHTAVWGVAVFNKTVAVAALCCPGGLPTTQDRIGAILTAAALLESKSGQINSGSAPLFNRLATSGQKSITLVRHRSLESLADPLLQELEHRLAASPVAIACLAEDRKTIRTLGLTAPIDTRLLKAILTGVSCSGAATHTIMLEAELQLDARGPGQFRQGIPMRLEDNRPGILFVGQQTDDSLLTLRGAEVAEDTAELISNAESLEALEALSFRDSLTGMANQRYLLHRLPQEIERARRHQRSLAIVMFDVDDLKSVNDRNGHQAGDQAIVAIAQGVRRLVRANDVVARYGGDEFCVLMPDADARQCERLLKRLVRELSRHADKSSPGQSGLSASFGAAIFPKHADTAERLIYCADMALLQAKAAGRLHWLVYDPAS